ncbi:MAG: response regulator [Leptospiraceae bacterium]|nr:response regulator [Leptospiraceae bacterium]
MSIINARTILLVDDEEVQIILFSKLLTKIGYNVIQAYSGKQALEEVQNNKVDIVLLDISLDDRFDGLELAEEILKIIDLPIIFLSNYRTREIISKTEIISSYGFIPKGSELAIIENTVNTALKLFEFQKREKEINQKLKENEYRLKLAQASGNIGVWDLDIQTGKIVWDEKMHELYHSEENSQISLQIWEEKIHKDDLNSFKDTFNKSIDENLNINTEFRIITPEGKTKYIESYGTLLYSNKNEPTRIIGINIDVTKKKRTKIKLEKNKRK